MNKKGIGDIVFMINATGSMKPCLDALKSNLGTLVDKMVNPGAYETVVFNDWRIKVCAYRDVTSDGDQWWEEKSFTNDISQVRSDLAALEAKGGGDEPQSLLDALWKVASLPAAEKDAPAQLDAWRHHHDARRLVIIFSVSSCHMATSLPEAGGANFEDVVFKVMLARLRLFIYAPEHECYETIGQIDRSYISLIGTLSDAQAAMAAYAADSKNFMKLKEAMLGQLCKAEAVEPVDLIDDGPKTQTQCAAEKWVGAHNKVEIDRVSDIPKK